MVLRSQVAAPLSRRPQQGRIGPQVEARRLLSRARRGPRPLLRQPGLSRLRPRSEEHTSELQSRRHLVCRLLLENILVNAIGAEFTQRRARDVGSKLSEEPK